MFSLSKPYQFAGSFVAGAFVAGALMAFAMNSPASHVAAARKPAQAATGESLDRLRREAASGDDFSNRQLSGALLDRYDLAGNSDDLYEALVWIDRQWDGSGSGELLGRVVARYCDQRVVRWHRLCIAGE